MTDKTIPNIEILQEQLEGHILDGSWRRILHTLAITGVVDNQQLIRASGLDRDKLRRTLDKMTAAASGFPPLFAAYDRKLRRAGKQGTAPRVYRLAESGAALCRLDGLADAHACQLEAPRAILHALGMLDVHLAARDKQLQVSTDRQVTYGDGNFIRPDNLVTLEGDTKAIFESEQDARSDYFNRILRSLAHKLAFFESDVSVSFSPVIRMLVDLPRGKTWQQTIKTWRQAMEITTETYGDELPFRLLAMPLGEFLHNPDWEVEPDENRWADLTAPDSAIIALAEQSEAVLTTMPAFTNQERQLILMALYQDLKENARLQSQAFPDPEFLYTMRLIYLASHDPFAPLLQRSGVPYESLYLLDQYLKMNPELRQRIIQTTQMDARRIHWNQTVALHRMQVVVDAFLEYHGWQSGGALLAYPYTPDYHTRGPRHLSVAVEITNPEILTPEAVAIVPDKKEIQILESSLAWVLTALFAHTPHLGLPKPPFW
jgi:hypothetical protein